jgi:hypothetical protein
MTAVPMFQWFQTFLLLVAGLVYIRYVLWVNNR